MTQTFFSSLPPMGEHSYAPFIAALFILGLILLGVTIYLSRKNR